MTTATRHPAVPRRPCRQPACVRKCLQEARAKWKAGTLPHDALREVEDQCIAAAIARQEEIGLRAATDGEYRRAYWHYDFVAGLDGVEIYEPEQKIQFQGNVPLTHKLRVNGRIGWTQADDDRPFPVPRRPRANGGAEADHPVAVGGAFPRRAAKRSTQATYPTLEPFFADLGAAYKQGGRAHSATPAAAICNWMRSTSPICATPSRSPC